MGNRAHSTDIRVKRRFLTQPFYVAEVFTGTTGVYVKLEDTIRGFKEILDGKHDSKNEQAFYMKGGISEVKDEPKKAEAAAKAEKSEAKQ